MRLMPLTVTPSDSVAHARALLDERRIKHLPVIFRERLIGIISAQDLDARSFRSRHSGLAKELKLHPDRVRISCVMTSDVCTVTPSDDLSHAAELMQRKHIGALPVLERGRLAGIICRSDVPDPLARRAKTKLDAIGRRDHSRQRQRFRRSVAA